MSEYNNGKQRSVNFNNKFSANGIKYSDNICNNTLDNGSDPSFLTCR